MSAQPETDSSLVTGLQQCTAEDKELTLAFQRGEKGAYQAIHDRYGARVHSVCRRMLIHPHDAEEAAQEAFLRTYQALGRFNGRYQLGAWITRIATNVCLDHLRSRARKGGHDVLSIELAELETWEGGAEGTEEVVIRRAESRRVRRVLETLPPRHRAAIALRDFEGLSYEEVAIALDITVPQVKALLHRARQRFKRSWLSEIASIFVPWRLVDRLRATEASVREPVANQAASFVAQTAPACTTALQHCGQYLVDKVAPVVTVALLGAAAAGPVAAPPADRQGSTDLRMETTVSKERGLWGLDGEPGQTRARKRAAKVVQNVPAPVEEEPVVDPVETPAPAATPEPEPTGTPTEPADGGTHQGGTGGDSTFEPKPDLLAAVGFSGSGDIPSSAPSEYSTDLDCASKTMDHHLTTKIHHDGKTYPVALTLYWSGDDLTVWTTIEKAPYTLTYPGSAKLVETQQAGSYTRLRWVGWYGTDAQAEEAQMPDDGPLRVEMSLDCDAAYVVHESVIFAS